jgi:DNA (cytosine-5)-methyltransferase 1
MGGARQRGGFSHDDGPVVGSVTASTGGADENDAADGRLVAAYGGNRTSGDIDIAAAVRSHGGSGRMDFETETFIAHTLRAEGFDASEDSTLRAMGHSGSHQNGGGHAAVSVSLRGREGGVSAEIGGETNPTLRASQGGGDKAFALISTGVRRLTPIEWERLQGFRDNYTLVTIRGKPAADGPRYKALGNSMPVPVMRWLGKRISAALDMEAA